MLATTIHQPRMMMVHVIIAHAEGMAVPQQAQSTP
jgi:hypothetical protein